MICFRLSIISNDKDIRHKYLRRQAWVLGMSTLNNYFCTLKHTFNNNYSRIRWRAQVICNITGVISSILRGSCPKCQLNLAFIVMWNSYSWGITTVHTCIYCYNSSIYFPAHYGHWWWSIIPAGQLQIGPSSKKLCWISINCHRWYIWNWNTVGIRMKYFGTPFDFPLSQGQETQQECLFLLNWPLCITSL